MENGDNMKQIKMIVCDLDGTLLNEEQKILTNNIEILKALQKQGIILVLASGRNYMKIKDYGLQLDMDLYQGYFIGGNGVFLSDACGNKIYEEKKMTMEQAQKIIAYLMQYQEEIITLFDDGLFCYLPKMIKDQKLKLIKQYQLDPNVLTCGPYDDFVDHRKNYPKLKYIEDVNAIDRAVNKVCMKVNEAKLKQIYPFIVKDLNDYWCGCVSSMWLEITLKTINKAHMVRKLCELVNISLDEVIAFGDGENDIELLKSVGKAIAMGNALPQVKALCDEVCLDHNQDGIYQALKLHTKINL